MTTECLPGFMSKPRYITTTSVYEGFKTCMGQHRLYAYIIKLAAPETKH